MSADNAFDFVDKSGFAFQLAVESAVRGAQSKFKVLATEYGWKNERTGGSGFADALLHDEQTPGIRLVVECKRPSGANWAFLCPDESLKRATNRWAKTKETLEREAIVRWTGVNAANTSRATDGFLWSRPSPYSAFCTVHGHAEGHTPMLERIASELVQATEAIADEQMAIDVEHRLHPNFGTAVWIYVPVIVTTARLTVCEFDPADISIADGLLPKNATFTDVSLVRFVKNFSHDYEVRDHPTLTSAHAAKDRTVMVVNAEAFANFLRTFDVTGNLPETMNAFLFPHAR